MNFSNLKIYKNAINIKKYKLINNAKASYIVYDPIILHNDESFSNNIIPASLKTYVDTLINTFPKEYLNVLFNNLKTIKYKVSLENAEIFRSIIGIITDIGSTEGYYNPVSNEITVISKKQKEIFSSIANDKYISYEDIINNILSHEIFHVATSLVNNNIQFCGFYQSYKLYDIGNGINEGYTELLARRYFDKEKGYYDDEVLITSLVEEIIGSDLMLDAYFKMDLNKLINLLKEYSNIHMAKRFIINLDNYCHNPSDKLLEAILLFIINMNKNKLSKNKDISNIEINKKNNEYTELIMSYVNKENIKAVLKRKLN